MAKKKIELSFDDGNMLDLRLAEMLDKHNLTATFYLNNVSQLSKKDIRELAKKHKIGGHTANHFLLTRIPLDMAEKEIETNKKYLEDIINARVIKFCYPRGYFNNDIKYLVEKAGYESARTTKILSTALSPDFYETNTTIHVYQNPNYGNESWHNAAIRTLNGDGNYWHLWGHSLEIDRDNNWELLDDILGRVSEYLYSE